MITCTFASNADNRQVLALGVNDVDIIKMRGDGVLVVDLDKQGIEKDSLSHIFIFSGRNQESLERQFSDKIDENTIIVGDDEDYLMRAMDLAIKFDDLGISGISSILRKIPLDLRGKKFVKKAESLLPVISAFYNHPTDKTMSNPDHPADTNTSAKKDQHPEPCDGKVPTDASVNDAPHPDHEDNPIPINADTVRVSVSARTLKNLLVAHQLAAEGGFYARCMNIQNQQFLLSAVMEAQNAVNEFDQMMSQVPATPLPEPGSHYHTPGR